MPYVEELAEKAGEGSGAFLQKKVTSMHVCTPVACMYMYKETRMVWTLFTFFFKLSSAKVTTAVELIHLA